MNEKLKQKLAYWIENTIYIGALAFGFSILFGGLYAIYTVIKALIG
jgi:hypothetical protein